MDFSQSFQTAQNQNQLSGLLTVQSWVSELPGGTLPVAGGLILLDVAGMGGVVQTFGPAAGERMLREVIDRARAALPNDATLVTGAQNTLLAWLPGINSVIAQAFISHLKQAICAKPVLLPGGEQIYPRLITTAISVDAGGRATDAIQALERDLIRQPEFHEAPAKVTRAVSAQEEMAHRLDALRLFGRDGLVEQVLARLSLPALQPESVVIVGPPHSGKTRLLASLTNLLGGQHLPMAEVTCLPSDQTVSFSLLVAVITQFFNAYPSEMLHQRLGILVQANTWLGRIFPALGGVGDVTPDDPALLRLVLQQVLMELVRCIPHVALIHSLHLADPESLYVFETLQGMNGHGLRIIAGTDPEDGELPGVLHGLTRQNAFVLTLPPFTLEQVQTYLKEVAPGIDQPTIAGALYAATGGLPLAIETTLRAWVEDGLLTFHDGVWQFFPQRLSQAEAGLGMTDRERLGQAALAGPVPSSFLTTLWQTTDEEAQATIARGRALGYLMPPDPEKPETVQFVVEHANAMSQRLTREQRQATHAAIAALLEASPHSDRLRYSVDMAYHLNASGQRERAEPFIQIVQLPMQAMAANTGSGTETLYGWNIPPAAPVGQADIQGIVDTVQTVRLAIVQFRLYPPSSGTVQRAVQAATRALDEYFRRRPSLIITYDGYNISVDGQVLERRDLQISLKDFQSWMTVGHVGAVGFAAGVTEDELSRFLEKVATYEPRDETLTLVDVVERLNLVNIKVLSRAVLPYVPQVSSSSNAAWQRSVAPPNTAALGGAEGGQGAASAGAPQSDLLPLEGAQDSLSSLSNPTDLAPEDWESLPTMMNRATPHVRRLMMSNLGRWLREQETQDTADVPGEVDQLLAQRVMEETDLVALRETVMTAEKRLDILMSRHCWDDMIALLEPVHARLEQDQHPDVQRLLANTLDHIGESTALRGLIDTTVQHPGSLERARRLVILLGERALRPLITALKHTQMMQERVCLMQLLREFGDTQQPLLLQELRQHNAWYIYRNLLQVLAEVGTEEALGTIAEKIYHSDPRVRAEAVAAATYIAREKATPYLAQGLEDEDANVRARAASLVGLCPHPRTLDLVLKLVMTPRMAKEETESVQLAACLALGQFSEAAARDALLQILHPRLFSPLRRKSDEIRSAAVTALASHLPHPEVVTAMQNAQHDRSLVVRQTAQRIWRQYQMEGGQGEHSR